MLKPLKVSVVVPALNEQNNVRAAIRSILEGFAYYKYDGEIIVVDDGSDDLTREIAQEEEKKDSRVRVIVHDENQGIGRSFWDGYSATSGNVITMIPGDNENDAIEVFRYVELLEHVDLVIPFIFNRQVRSLYRNILSSLYRAIINTTFNITLNYTNGTVLYRRSALGQLTTECSGFFFQTDIIIRLIKSNHSFAEVPHLLRDKADKKTEAVSFPSFVQVVSGYVKLIRDQYFKG
jgi:glycosyltransferase involved in cell wall biosynthesis